MVVRRKWWTHIHKKIHTNNRLSFRRQVVYEWLCPIDIRRLRWQNIPVSLIRSLISFVFLLRSCSVPLWMETAAPLQWHSGVQEPLSYVSAVLYPDPIVSGLASLAARQSAALQQKRQMFDCCSESVSKMSLFSHTPTHAHTHRRAYTHWRMRTSFNVIGMRISGRLIYWCSMSTLPAIGLWKMQLRKDFLPILLWKKNSNLRPATHHNNSV